MYTSLWIGITRKRTIQIFIPRPSQSFEMGLRSVFNAWILLVFLWTKSHAAQTYQPPLLLGAPPAPIPAPLQNSYHPPLVGPADSHPVSFQQGSSQSVQYSFPSASHAQESTSYSVHQQPSLHSEASGFQQSSAERTSHSKAIGSSHVPVQAIHKAPASEIESDKGSAAKEKDNKNDEYVVYYYYYYDNDTLPNNNLSLNFDDIPSLESYDEDKARKEPQKSASARTLAANVNSLASTVSDPKQASDSSSSQPRSASGIDKEAVIKVDNNFDDDVGEHIKPVPNIYRYGTNEVPRFPVLHIPEAPSTNRPLDSVTPLPAFSDSPTTQQSFVNSQFSNVNNDEELEDDAVNNVLDNTAESKSSDRFAEEDTTTVPTTNPPTTTEVPTTTTTEKSRRRPSIGGGRRRFNAAPPSSRTRPPTRSTTSTTTTTTTTSTPPTRRSFQGSNRVRPRPSINTNRGRVSSRGTTESSDDQPSSTTESTTVSSTTSRSRFTSAPRRFQSSRTRSQASSAASSSTSSTTTTSTPRSSTSSSSIRSRPSSRPAPRVNLISRSRPPRPGFIRPRPGSEPEVTEATTSTPEIVETSPEVIIEEANNEKSSENDETSEEESEEPTTTEASRFSALFRPRNRSSLGNRPRPVIGNRPSRS